jgi:hypothetical protein
VSHPPRVMLALAAAGISLSTGSSTAPTHPGGSRRQASTASRSNDGGRVSHSQLSATRRSASAIASAILRACSGCAAKIKLSERTEKARREENDMHNPSNFAGLRIQCTLRARDACEQASAAARASFHALGARIASERPRRAQHTVQTVVETLVFKAQILLAMGP